MEQFTIVKENVICHKESFKFGKFSKCSYAICIYITSFHLKELFKSVNRAKMFLCYVYVQTCLHFKEVNFVQRGHHIHTLYF